jgi:TM2 domain-containing membrane protein YozV
LLALVLGILGLGWIGVHKFYLGYTGAGLIMLIGSIVTCGLAGAVFTIIAIIEGIIYLVQTDSQFDSNYVYSRREWF